MQQAISDLTVLLRDDGFQILLIAIFHALRASAYSQLHPEPFNRNLAVQSEPEQLVLITADSQLASFLCRQLCEG